MTAPIRMHVAPKDWEMIRKARKRGGQAAVDKLLNALARQKVDGVKWREKVAAQMLADDGEDHAWPPAFLSKPVKLPPDGGKSG
jgi:hypothetical protein